MALPRLKNDIPKYDLIIPSTGNTVKFRPFLVKEQKVLLMAFESKDNKQMINSMLDCLSSCVPDASIDELATFDVDYMFSQVRSKSVGETTTILHACSNCNEENEVKIRLDQIKVDIDENFKKTKDIEIDKNIIVELKYPSYADVSKNVNIDENTSDTELLTESLMACIKAVKTEEEYLLIKDEPKEEVERFVNSLTNQQLEMITKFAQSVPKLKHTENYECKKCKTENKIELEGLQDFF
jgi:hypothetical protein|tara:strand:+ start:16 stop:735 length:720 start_codon:yes stop_codon:yes gene_type:complete